jgi:opacity protein-like surface antigen
MGGAYTAIADDAHAPEYNPAGIAQTESIAGAFTRTAFFSGITAPLVVQDSASGVVRLGSGGIGAGITSLADADGVYRQTALSLGYGLTFGSRLRAGLLGKWYRAGLDTANPDVTENPYFENGTSASAVTVDVGALFTPTDGLTFGVSGQNLLPADLTFVEPEDAEADKMPALVRAGVAYRLEAVASSAEQVALQGILKRSLVAADIGVGDGTALAAGVEIGLAHSLTVRVGYRSLSGNEGASAITSGATVHLNTSTIAAHLDYGLDIANSDLKDNLTQRVSLRIGF